MADDDNITYYAKDDDVIAIQNPGGTGFRIQELWAFVAVHGDGDEGVVGVITPNGMIPAIGADEKRIKDLRPLIEEMVAASKMPIKLVRFSNVTVEETISE